jgi:hypothetical protein
MQQEVEDKVSWRQKSNSDTRLHLDDGKQFSRSAGTPEVESAWTSDSKWISMGPTTSTLISTVESLQASSGGNARVDADVL